MDIYEVHRRVAYLLHEWDSPNGRTDRENYRDDFITLLDCAHQVFRENLDIMSQLPNSQSDPVIGLRKIEALTRQCYETTQDDTAVEKKGNFHEFIKKLDREKAPPENVQYDYPDHPFIVGYRRPRNEVEWTVRQLNKAFNQANNFQNPKWAWMGGELSNETISLLEKFVGQPWEEDTSRIDNMVDLVSVAYESETKDRFLGLLKSKLRRCCNIQNPDLLAWEEIFAAINEYMSSEQKKKDRLEERAGTQADIVSTKENGKKTMSQIIEQGEGNTIEFKETLEYSVKEKKQDTNLNKECLKTIAAFLNTDGGTLLIGVRDNGEITGIQRDLPYVQRKNEDGFQLKLRDLIKSRLAPFPSGKVNIQFEKLAKGMVCRVDVEPVNKNQIIHLDKDVYI